LYCCIAKVSTVFIANNSCVADLSGLRIGKLVFEVSFVSGLGVVETEFAWAKGSFDR